MSTADRSSRGSTGKGGLRGPDIDVLYGQAADAEEGQRVALEGITVSARNSRMAAARLLYLLDNAQPGGEVEALLQKSFKVAEESEEDEIAKEEARSCAAFREYRRRCKPFQRRLIDTTMPAIVHGGIGIQMGTTIEGETQVEPLSMAGHKQLRAVG